MKKRYLILFILFGVLVLNISSCKVVNSSKIYEISSSSKQNISNSTISNNKKYEEYEYSEQLNSEILNMNYSYGENEPLPPIDISTLSYTYGNYKSYLVSTSSSINDFYLCAYLSNDILEIIENTEYFEPYGNLSWNLWLGKNYYLIKYKNAVSYNKTIDYQIYPIKWYKVPINKEIPNEIENSFLILISEIKDVYIENLDKSDAMCIDLIIERQDLYSETISNFDYNNYQYSIQILDSDNINLIFDYNSAFSKNIILFNKYWDLLEYFSFDVLTIDEETYINTLSDTMWNEIDLKEIYEYKILNEKEYLFKLKDLSVLLVGNSSY